VSIESGTRLGPYEIVAPIGAGGMGEVYRARDTRLDRSVAIKIVTDESLKQRFDREAKTISSLNHPNICALYDVGDSYIVMEYVEGESLADRLAKGPLPIDQVLRMGVEIASALDRAHQQGIVHRDIKPGNIMLTKSGAKLLDFGLARVAAGFSPPDGGLKAAATLKKPLTEEGTLLGTFQYMAPEQLDGLPADARTDIFALGAVLYESTTGKRAFEGKSRASLIASILDHEPAPISVVRPMSPPSLDRVVRACLRKDPAERIQTAHDLMLDLNWIRESSSAGEGFAVSAPRRRRQRLMLAPIVLLAATTIVFAMLWVRGRHTAPEPATFSLLSAPGTSNGETVAIAPDGRSVAYIGGRAGTEPLLWIRRFADAEPHSMAATDGANRPFWSPDGQWVAFFAHGKLKKVSLATGSVKEIGDGDYGIGGAWNRDGTILFAKRFNDGLYRVPASGGEPVRVTTLDSSRHESAHAWPQFLSDGKHFVYLNHTTGDERNQIHVRSLDGGVPKSLVSADSLVGVDPPYLLYVKENVLYAQRLDEGKLALQGDPIEVAGNVAYSETWTTSGASVSPAGVIAYFPVYLPKVEVRMYDRSGAIAKTLLSDAGVGLPQLSPDGRRLLMTKSDPKKGAEDIWIGDLDRGVQTRITGGLSNHEVPSWSPDGKRVVFLSDRGGMYDLYAQAVDEGGDPTVVWKSERDKGVPSWSPDGRSIVVTLDQPKTYEDLWMVPLDGGPPRPILVTPAIERGPVLSPDGQWIAFDSNRSGIYEICIRRLSGGRIVQVSTKGGEQPQWSHDGKELFYLAPERMLMSGPIVHGEPGVPRPLFTLPRASASPRPFTVTSDGHFVVPATIQGDVNPDHINVLLGWRGKR
jgi:Tol biopolymer transport system component/predicted Ser/Thr protein kinase